MTLENEQIKLIISALDEKFVEEKSKYEVTKSEIQKLCKHTNLVSVMMGRKCEICGLFIHDEDKLKHYILVEK